MTEYGGLCGCGVSCCRMPLRVIVVGFCLAFACWVLELMRGAGVACDEVSQCHGRPCRRDRWTRPVPLMQHQGSCGACSASGSWQRLPVCHHQRRVARDSCCRESLSLTCCCAFVVVQNCLTGCRLFHGNLSEQLGSLPCAGM
jgi:hypothetical protein